MSAPADLAALKASIDPVGRSSFAKDEDRLAALAAAQALCLRLEKPAETIYRTAWIDPSTLAAIKVADDSGLFSKLCDHGGPVSTAQLSHKAGVDAALAGFVSETAEDEWAPNELSQAMTQPSMNGAYAFTFDIFLPTLAKMTDFFEMHGYGNPDELPMPFKYAQNTDLNMFQWYAERPKQEARFLDSMTGYTSARPGWLDTYPIEKLITGAKQERDAVFFVDIGGGYGADTERLLARHPNPPGRLVLQDQPSVVGGAPPNARIEKMPYDFYTPQPLAGARCYFMHSIMHDYDDATCRRILANLRPALAPGYSTLLINDMVIPPTKAHIFATSLDVDMFFNLGGKERKAAEWHALLESEGFRIVKIHTSSAIESIIEAVAN